MFNSSMIISVPKPVANWFLNNHKKCASWWMPTWTQWHSWVKKLQCELVSEQLFVNVIVCWCKRESKMGVRVGVGEREGERERERTNGPDLVFAVLCHRWSMLSRQIFQRSSKLKSGAKSSKKERKSLRAQREFCSSLTSQALLCYWSKIELI